MSINEIWASEESMAETFTRLTKLSKFDRTKNASLLVRKVMAQLATPHPTFYDAAQWVQANVRDFNIATQILLNMTECLPLFDTAGMEAVINEEKPKWAGKADDPFAPKAKFTEGNEERNNLLSLVRNYQLITSAEGPMSFRVSPIGSTPALADARNLTSLSLYGLDRFSSLKSLIVNHEKAAASMNLRMTDKGWVADGLETPILSKSGAEIAAKALVVRWLTYKLFIEAKVNFVVPKYDSILVLSPSDALLGLFSEWLSVYPGKA